MVYIFLSFALDSHEKQNLACLLQSVQALLPIITLSTNHSLSRMLLFLLAILQWLQTWFIQSDFRVGTVHFIIACMYGSVRLTGKGCLGKTDNTSVS